MIVNLDFVFKTIKTCDKICFKTVRTMERCPFLSAGAALITAIFIKVIERLLDKFIQNENSPLAFYRSTITYSYLQSHSLRDLAIIALPWWKNTSWADHNNSFRKFDLHIAAAQCKKYGDRITYQNGLWFQAYQKEVDFHFDLWLSLPDEKRLSFARSFVSESQNLIDHQICPAYLFIEKIVKHLVDDHPQDKKLESPAPYVKLLQYRQSQLCKEYWKKFLSSGAFQFSSENITTTCKTAEEFTKEIRNWFSLSDKKFDQCLGDVVRSWNGDLATILQSEKIPPRVFIALLGEKPSSQEDSFHKTFYRDLFLYTCRQESKLKDLEIKKEDCQQIISFVIRNLDEAWETLEEEPRHYILKILYENCCIKDDKQRSFMPMEFLFHYLDSPETVYSQEKLSSKKTSASLQHRKEILRYLVNVEAPVRRIKTYFNKKQQKEPCAIVEEILGNLFGPQSKKIEVFKDCLLLNKNKEELQEFVQGILEESLFHVEKAWPNSSKGKLCGNICGDVIGYLLKAYEDNPAPIFEALGHIYQKKDPKITPIFEEQREIRLDDLKVSISYFCKMIAGFLEKPYLFSNINIDLFGNTLQPLVSTDPQQIATLTKLSEKHVLESTFKSWGHLYFPYENEQKELSLSYVACIKGMASWPLELKPKLEKWLSGDGLYSEILGILVQAFKERKIDENLAPASILNIGFEVLYSWGNNFVFSFLDEECSWLLDKVFSHQMLLSIVQDLKSQLLTKSWGPEILRKRDVWLEISSSELEDLYQAGAQPYFLEHINSSETLENLVQLMKNFPSMAFENVEILSCAFQKVQWFPFMCNLLKTFNATQGPVLKAIFHSLYQHREKLIVEDLWREQPLEGNSTEVQRPFDQLLELVSHVNHLMKIDMKNIRFFLNAIPLEIRFNIHLIDGFISSDFFYGKIFSHWDEVTDEKLFGEKLLESIEQYIINYLKDAPKDKAVKFLEYLSDRKRSNLNGKICEIYERHPYLLPAAVDHYFGNYWIGISNKFNDLSKVAWMHSSDCGVSFWVSSLKNYSFQKECWTKIDEMIEKSETQSPMKLFWKDKKTALHLLQELPLENLSFLPASVINDMDLILEFVEADEDDKEKFEIFNQIFNLIDIKTIPQEKYEIYFNLLNVHVSWKNPSVFAIKAPLPKFRPENEFNEIEKFWLKRGKENPLFYLALPPWAQTDEEYIAPLAEKYPFLPGFMYATAKGTEFDKIVEQLCEKSLNVYFWTLFSCVSGNISGNRIKNFFSTELYTKVCCSWDFSISLGYNNKYEYFKFCCLKNHRLNEIAKKLVKDYMEKYKFYLYPISYDWFPPELMDPQSVITTIQNNWSHPENQLSEVHVRVWSSRTEKTMIMMLSCLKALPINFNVKPLKRRLWALIIYNDAKNFDAKQKMIMMLKCLKALSINFNVKPLKQRLWDLIN